MISECQSIASLTELDALVGHHFIGETPETYWEDNHSCFQFSTEGEARRALEDPYYRRFLPDRDWSRAYVREIQVYRKYSVDAALNWEVAEKAVSRFGPLQVWREAGRWRARFGAAAHAEALTPPVAICVAVLRAGGMTVDLDHFRIDAEFRQEFVPVMHGIPFRV